MAAVTRGPCLLYYSLGILATALARDFGLPVEWMFWMLSAALPAVAAECLRSVQHLSTLALALVDVLNRKFV